MKNKIWQKYLICLAVMVVLVGVVVNVIGRSHTAKAYAKKHRSRLVEESRLISREYVRESRNAGLTKEQFELQMRAVHEMTDLEVWIVSGEGRILIATEDGVTGSIVPQEVLNTNWSE